MTRLLTAFALCAGLALSGCTDSALTEATSSSAVNDSADLAIAYIQGPDAGGVGCVFTYTAKRSGSAGAWSLQDSKASIVSTGTNASGEPYAIVSIDYMPPRPVGDTFYFDLYWDLDGPTAPISKEVAVAAQYQCS